MTSPEWMISYCGLNCAKCSLYLFPEDQKKAEEVLNWFKENRWKPKDLTVSEFMKNNGKECMGCSSKLEPKWSPDCIFRLCAQKRKIKYCFKCVEFPCRNLTDFANDGNKHHYQTVENLKRMKKIGLNAFIREQPEVCFCPGLSE